MNTYEKYTYDRQFPAGQRDSSPAPKSALLTSNRSFPAPAGGSNSMALKILQQQACVQTDRGQSPGYTRCNIIQGIFEDGFSEQNIGRKTDEEIRDHVSQSFVQIGLLIDNSDNAKEVKSIICELALLPTGRKLIKHMSSSYLDAVTDGADIEQYRALQNYTYKLTSLCNHVAGDKYELILELKNEIAQDIATTPFSAQHMDLDHRLSEYLSLTDLLKSEDSDYETLMKEVFDAKNILSSSINTSLNLLKEQLAGQKVITIKQGDNAAEPLNADRAENGQGTGSEVSYNFRANSTATLQEKLLQLSHELIHAMHNQYGKKNSDYGREEMATIGLVQAGEATRARTEAEYAELEEIMRITENNIILELNTKDNLHFPLRQSHE